MATTSTRNLISSTPILYMREKVLRCTVRDVKPNTKLYVFFGDEDITSKCRMDHNWSHYSNNTDGGLNVIDGIAAPSGDIISDDVGTANFLFNLEGGKYLAGSRNITVSDVQNLDELKIIGNTHGSATTTYSSKGTLETYQRTNTTVNTVVVTEVVDRVMGATDPIAQSFFTDGFTGGLYITSIDLYFQSKDSSIPVRLEIRPMVNGYPAPFTGDSNLVVSLLPSQVNVSNNSSIKTTFRFSKPVYLSENKDYCFVVLSNSNNYNVFTSYMGERSLETGNIIFKQPYLGSCFKSQNNSTWTAEQFEDIKFTINRAKFDTTVSSDIVYVGESARRAYQGTNFTTKSGSKEVVFKGLLKHGLKVGDKIVTDVDVSGTYNGISGANFTGVHVVTKIIDEYILAYDVATNATVSGPIYQSGVVSAIQIDNAGSGYTVAPTIVIGAPPSGGTQATATATVSGGKISSITITNKGSGYITDPSVIISGVGSGASLTAKTNAVVVISTNKPVSIISPQIQYVENNGTRVVSKIRTIDKDYNITQQSDLKLHSINGMDVETLIPSRFNTADHGNPNPLELTLSLSTGVDNLSPMIETTNMSLLAYSKSINDHSGTESKTSTISSSGIVGISDLYGGTGYSSAPSITVVPAENETSTNIVPAVLTATVSGGAVTGITITSAGSGYTVAPTIVIGTGGSQATAKAVLSPLNSEINNIGNAYSRYITKKIVLKEPSTAVKLTSYLYSTPETDVDWYIRTSMAGDASNHEDNKWVLLKCDVERNKSTKPNQFFDYEFLLTGIQPFDTYDLKCVMSSSNPAKTPYIKNYRVVVAS